MTTSSRTTQATYDASSPTAAGTKLSNRAARSGSTIHGWPAVTAGTLVMAFGGLIAALMLGLVAPDAVRVSAGFPRWIVALGGGIFAFAGLSLAVHGFGGVRRLARVRALRAVHPGEPWR